MPPPPPRTKGHTRLRIRGWGSLNSNDRAKSLAPCLLCGLDSKQHSRYRWTAREGKPQPKRDAPSLREEEIKAKASRQRLICYWNPVCASADWSWKGGEEFCGGCASVQCTGTCVRAEINSLLCTKQPQSGSIKTCYPSDPYVFEPPGSGSICQRHGSGSFYHQAKIVRKTLIPTVLLLLFDFLSLENDVNVPSKSNKQQKLFLTNLFFVGLLKVNGENSRIPGSISQRHGSADPDPHKNVMDPQHCLLPS